MGKIYKLNTYNNAVVVVKEEEIKQYISGIAGLEEEKVTDTIIENFLNDYTYDESEYMFDIGLGFKLLGYFIDRDDLKAGEVNAHTVCVVIDVRDDNLIFYSPSGQHSEGGRDYFEDCCMRITKEQYLEAAGQNGTPACYL